MGWELTWAHGHRPQMRQNKRRHGFSVDLLPHRLMYVQCCEHNSRLYIEHRQSPSDFGRLETHLLFGS